MSVLGLKLVVLEVIGKHSMAEFDPQLPQGFILTLPLVTV